MTRLKKTIITFIIGFVVTFIFVWTSGFFTTDSLVEKLRIICDGFFISGAIIFCFGLILFCQTEGTFDLILFSLKKMGAFFVPIKRFKGTRDKSFAEYREEQAVKVRPFLHLIISGFLHIVIAVVMLIVYLHFE